MARGDRRARLAPAAADADRLDTRGLDLLLVRHGVTGHNRDRIFMGWGPVPLAPEGRAQIESLGERLRGERLTRIIASDIHRTVESAEILSRILERPFETHPALREVNVGEAIGVSYDDAAARWPGLLERDGRVRFPGGESFDDVADRASEYLRAEILREGDDRVLVVTHGGVVIGVAARLLGRSLADMGTFAVENASLTLIRWTGGAAELVRWNDTSHLPPAEAEAVTPRSEAQAPRSSSTPRRDWEGTGG